MGKYDFDLELVGQNSLLLILEQIRKGSTVLEFGPANGRLTKYLNQSLQCRMYLVEIDEDAGKEALQYAEDLVVGDAEAYEWVERYQDIRFDYLIFADILEHLRDPQRVLATAKRLLKEDGSILLSAPNLAHNAVMINLLNNNFEYQKTGLLDNTHIHFFTINSLEHMLEEAGMYPVKRFATYCKTSDCEIAAAADALEPAISREFWNNRPYGEVYQFIYEAKKNREFATETENYIRTSVSASYLQVFLNFPDSISEEMSIKRTLGQYEGKNVFEIRFPEPQKQVRLDPMNCCGIVNLCAVTGISDGREAAMTMIGSNAEFQLDQYFFFANEDPQFYYAAQNGESIEGLHVEAEYMELGSRNVERILGMVKEYAQRERENAQILEEKIKSQTEELDKLSVQKENWEKAYTTKSQSEENDLEMSIKIAEIQKDCNARIRKEKLEFQKMEALYQERIEQLETEHYMASNGTNEIEERIKSQEQYIGSLKELLVEKDRIIQNQDKEIQGFFHSKTWKINRIVTKILHLK